MMQYHKFLIILLSLLFARLIAFSQHHQSDPPQPPFRKKIQVANSERKLTSMSGNCLLKLTPSSLLDPMGVTIPFSAEYYFDDKNSLQAGVGIPIFHSYNVSLQIKQDIMTRFEYRNYMHIRPVTRNFIGIEAWGRYQQFIVDNNWQASKKAMGAGLFFGRQYKVISNFYLDWKIGIGNMYFVSRNYIHHPLATGEIKHSYTYFDQDRISEGFAKYVILGLNFAYAL